MVFCIFSVSLNVSVQLVCSEFSTKFPVPLVSDVIEGLVAKFNRCIALMVDEVAKSNPGDEKEIHVLLSMACRIMERRKVLNRFAVVSTSLTD